MRMKRRTYSQLRAISLTVIAVALTGIVAGACSGGPSPSSAASTTTATSTPTPTATATPAAVGIVARHKHRRRHHKAPAPAVTTPAVVAVTTPAGCYPLSDEGTCYEPGEYCRDDDEGMTGRAGDGETIICEDNDGLRWEPV
jgi:hypothetical protein